MVSFCGAKNEFSFRQNETHNRTSTIVHETIEYGISVYVYLILLATGVYVSPLFCRVSAINSITRFELLVYI